MQLCTPFKKWNVHLATMKQVFQFHKHYFFLALLLFVTEILIAVYAHDDIIRPYFGDYLVVILLYCSLKAFVNIPVLPACILVLLFSYLMEMLQYFQLVQRLGLQQSDLAKTVLGNSFAWTDIVAYTAGIVTVYFVEKYRISVSGKNS
jgi:hypothetical protein